eukprot:TRINITY_DN3442_c0_g1_i1.p1 TRINITY_DN3442_c0_g1~~TRINITY_DN3442_c0_g1_i1.p1  ORF type:complete len:632 (+),score=162.58 TRINITY_DN3442_c0_g1_i1:110-1897(+)
MARAATPGDAAKGQIRVSMAELGRGAFGRVCMGLTESGELVAVKEINVSSSADQKEIAEARQEYELLQRLSHPNIVHVLDFVFDEGAQAARIVMEYVPGGSLSRVISSLGSLPDRACSNYTGELLSGLDYLHSVPPSGILHRDIKPHNILLRPEPGSDGAQVKLADFGLCAAIRDKSSQSQDALVGTVPYMSPGCIKGVYSRQSDIWATGCTVLEMATGKSPWRELGIRDPVPFMFHIGNKGGEGEHPQIPDSVSPALRQFLKRCFAAERQGITCATLRQDPFIVDPLAVPPEEEHDSPRADTSLERKETAAVLEEVGNLLQKEQQKQAQLGTELRRPGEPHWAFETSAVSVSNRWRTSFTPTTGPSSVGSAGYEYPHGPIFREDTKLPWEQFWNRIGQLPFFSGLLFQSRYQHVMPLVKYLMCCQGVDGMDVPEVSYVDDFEPFSRYFADVEGMVEDVAELNRRSLFLYGAGRQQVVDLMAKQPRGAILLRPSKQEKGKIALTVKFLGSKGVLETKHFIVVRQMETGRLTLFGASQCPTAPTLKALMDALKQKAGMDFKTGAGKREEPVSGGYEESAYAGGAYQRAEEIASFKA